MRICVIGSEHDRAECLAWLQLFPNLEEYDVLIVDLPTLGQEVLDRLSTEQPGKLEGWYPLS